MNLDIIKDISRYNEWASITVPADGWSLNLKFNVKDKEGNDYILKVSEISFLEEKNRNTIIL